MVEHLFFNYSCKYNLFDYLCSLKISNLLFSNEEQKRDPKLGNKDILLVYQCIREEIQIPLSPQLLLE
jgi:hypothetical protein